MKECYIDLEVRLEKNYNLLNKVLADINVTPEEFANDLALDRDLVVIVNRCIGKVQLTLLRQVFEANELRISPQVINRLLDSELFKDTVYKKYEKGSNKDVDFNKDIVIE